MHIAIEGMDGTGKSTMARILANHLGFKVVEKPLHYLLDSAEGELTNYIQARDKINAMLEDNQVRALFYGLGNVYLSRKFSNEHIVTDRHLASNFYWCGFKDTMEIFDLLVKLAGSPDFTFLIYASEAEIIKRLKCRDTMDPDISKVGRALDCRIKMESFLREYKMEFAAIDTTELTPYQVLQEMLRALPERCKVMSGGNKS